jgi:hypothetical protein
MPDFDPSKPSIARVYDYILGGKDNFAADRMLAERLIEIAPSIPDAVRENREMLTRAVGWAAERGIRQFIDLGCGMPTEPSTHGSAREIVPDARIAYADNDPVVVNHLDTLLGKDPAVAVISGDVGDPGTMLRAVTEVIDLSQPACLMMGALLHFYELAQARELVSRYTAALAPGSYVVFSAFEAAPGPDTDQLLKMYGAGPHSVTIHSVEDLVSFAGNLELVAPGVADARTWRPEWETVPAPAPRGVWIYGAMARVPG